MVEPMPLSIEPPPPCAGAGGGAWLAGAGGGLRAGAGRGAARGADLPPERRGMAVEGVEAAEGGRERGFSSFDR